MLELPREIYERQHNGDAAKDSVQEDAEEQEEEKNPAIANPHWESSDGSTLAKALVGDEVYLCADVTDIPDGASAKIKVVEKDDDGNDDDVTTLTTKVQDGKIKCKWKVVYMEDDDDSDSEQERAEKGYTLPEYAFTVECSGATSEESGQLDVRGWIRLQINGKNKINGEYKIYKTDGGLLCDWEKIKEDIFIRDVEIGKYYIRIRNK